RFAVRVHGSSNHSSLSRARQNVHDIPVLHDVRLAFQSIHPMAFRLLHGAEAFEIVVADNFAADEAAGEVGVDFGGAFDGAGALGNGPGPAFVVANGEKDDVAHRLENGAQDFGPGKTGHVQVLHKDLAIFLGEL